MVDIVFYLLDFSFNLKDLVVCLIAIELRDPLDLDFSESDDILICDFTHQMTYVWL